MQGCEVQVQFEMPATPTVLDIRLTHCNLFFSAQILSLSTAFLSLTGHDA